MNSLSDATAALDAIEARLAALSEALNTPDGRGIDAAAAETQRALAAALDHFQRRRAPLSHALRERLLRAGARVSAQRESLARATATIDRAMALLLPREAGVYNAQGAAEQPRHSGVARA